MTTMMPKAPRLKTTSVDLIEADVCLEISLEELAELLETKQVKCKDRSGVFYERNISISEYIDNFGEHVICVEANYYTIESARDFMIDSIKYEEEMKLFDQEKFEAELEKRKIKNLLELTDSEIKRFDAALDDLHKNREELASKLKSLS